MSALFIIGTDAAELKVVFDKLAVGAERETFPELHAMPFGTYGQFYDKYGMHWIFRGDASASSRGGRPFVRPLEGLLSATSKDARVKFSGGSFPGSKERR